MLLNIIRPMVDIILQTNHNSFRTDRSTSVQILTFRRFIENANEKNLEATILLIVYSKLSIT